jgi:hypothetical protein
MRSQKKTGQLIVLTHKAVFLTTQQQRSFRHNYLVAVLVRMEIRLFSVHSVERAIQIMGI